MFEALPSLNNCSPLVLDPSKQLTCLPVSSLPPTHLVSMLWLRCLSQRQLWSHLSSLKSLWCPFVVLMMKPRSFIWLTRPVVNGALLAILVLPLSTPHVVLNAPALKKKTHSSPKRQHFLPLSLSELFTYFSFCWSSCALFLLPPSYPFFFPSLLPNNTSLANGILLLLISQASVLTPLSLESLSYPLRLVSLLFTCLSLIIVSPSGGR